MTADACGEAMAGAGGGAKTGAGITDADAGNNGAPAASVRISAGSYTAMDAVASSGAACFDAVAGIQLDRITFGYGDKALFSEFSLELAAGKVTSIIGPNGCGKSTLLKLVSGANKPWSGAVRVCGREVANLPAKERAQLVSLLAQEHAAPPMSVRQLVTCGRYPHHGAFAKLGTEDYDAIEAALEATGLSALANANVGKLSGGQRQRAFIAMVLAQDTPLVLLDEPTSFLDVSANYDVMELMRSLKNEHGKTVVAVIHDINLALKYSDEVCVLRGGELIAQGTPQEPQVLTGVERAFDVRAELLTGQLGSAYALFKAE